MRYLFEASQHMPTTAAVWASVALQRDELSKLGVGV